MRLLYTFFLLTLSLTLFASDTPPSLQEILSTITPSEIEEHVTFLASDALEGRRTTTQGEKKAAEYIAKEFARYGLRPGGQQGFFQFFPITAGRTILAKLKVKLPQGKELSLRHEKDFLPYWFSGEGTFRATLRKLHLKELKKKSLSLKGLAVLVHQKSLKSPHPKKTKGKKQKIKGQGAIPVGERQFLRRVFHLAYQLEKKGAEALVVVVPKLQAYRMPSPLFGSKMAPMPVFFVSSSTAKQFQKGAILTGRVKVKLKKKRGRNVIAILPGADPQLRHEVIVIGAHYDHLGWGGQGSLAPNTRDIHHGADDNASGTAALLEIAEAFSIWEGLLKRTVVFIAFSGEEEGLVGSAHYVRHPRFPLKNTVAMLNLDMVGRLRKNTLHVFGTGTAKEWETILSHFNRYFQFRFKKGKSGFGPSDHASFYKKKIPVLHFFTGLHKDYHKPSDVAKKIQKKGCARIAQLVAAIGLHLAQRPHRLTYVYIQPPKRVRPRRGGPRPYFGIVPEYGGDGKGLALSAVQKGSPADKAGIRGGDIIIGIDGKRVRNIYDFAQILFDKKPGDKVKVQLLRKGKKLEVTVTLGEK